MGKEINVEDDKTLSPAEKILTELGLDYECSEVGNMCRFVDQHKDKLRFIPENKAWAVWDKTIRFWCDIIWT